MATVALRGTLKIGGGAADRLQTPSGKTVWVHQRIYKIDGQSIEIWPIQGAVGYHWNAPGQFDENGNSVSSYLTPEGAAAAIDRGIAAREQE